MNLSHITVEGYCRFKEKFNINLNGKLIAFIGTNEAGKTSLLNGVSTLNDGNAIPKNKRYSSEDYSGETYLSATFILNDDECIEANIVTDTKLVLTKDTNRGGQLEFIPEPAKRDLMPRKEVLKVIQSIIDDEQVIEKAEELKAGTKALFQGFRNSINNEGEDLNVAVLSQNITKIREAMDESDLSELINSKSPHLLEKLDELLKLETKPNPTKFAEQVCASKIPKFIMFSEQDRDLKYEYTVEEMRAPSNSLSTLSKLAELNLNDLSQRISDNQSAHIRRILNVANNNLKGIFENKWSQSILEVQMDVNDKKLQILMHDGEEHYTEFGQRSDGFRQFLALVAFCSLHKEQNIILLIDEIELHLHYDGQADLLQTLARQNLAHKVIYSTHSIGCLPEDLSGIKTIKRCNNNSFTSEIVSKFWVDKQGLMPLLPQMGAESLAFLPLRKALIVEGASDMLLLPKILNEVTDLDHTGFLIVEGLSESNLTNLLKLNCNGSSVVYLTDNDAGGKTLQESLVNNNIDEQLVFELPNPLSKDTVKLEDLIRPEIIKNAFNIVISKYADDKSPLVLEDFLGDDQEKKIVEAAEGKNLRGIKVTLSYEILELLLNNPALKFVKEEYYEPVKELYAQIKSRV